jgi:hypothetical protein
MSMGYLKHGERRFAFSTVLGRGTCGVVEWRGLDGKPVQCQLVAADEAGSAIGWPDKALLCEVTDPIRVVEKGTAHEQLEAVAYLPYTEY